MKGKHYETPYTTSPAHRYGIDPPMDRACGRTAPGPCGHAAGPGYPRAPADTGARADSPWQGGHGHRMPNPGAGDLDDPQCPERPSSGGPGHQRPGTDAGHACRGAAAAVSHTG